MVENSQTRLLLYANGSVLPRAVLSIDYRCSPTPLRGSIDVKILKRQFLPDDCFKYMPSKIGELIFFDQEALGYDQLARGGSIDERQIIDANSVRLDSLRVTAKISL